MMKVLSAAAAIAALTVAAPAFAQQTQPEASGASTSASTAAAEKPAAEAPPAAGADAAGANASVTAGMTVKDKTGASIGQVADVKADGGKTMATIKMGADTFAVDSANLAVDGGAATINATQAEIKQMLKK